MEENILNKKIGRYEIKEMIGEGAMAKVYRAYDPEINRSVAFKVLKEDHCVDEEYLSRFLREAKAAGALSHSGIVTVYDVGKIEKSPYIMMELLDGCDLGEVLKNNKKLPLKQTLIIALQLAKSLDYAHKSGIIHRDIKPDNIIVMPDGESIKVADFGIARMNETEESQKTQVGSVLGTPRYMSPEQALGDTVDGRSDLFSVGTIMYEMLSGNKAFDAGNMATLMIQIAQKQPEPLKTLCPDIPAGVRQIIQKLLQKSPDKRFQTGNKLAEALGKELSTLSDQQAEQKKHKYIPLKIRWTLSVAAIVGLVSFISINIVFNMQSSAMTKQAVDSGASFAKFISTETAIPILSEDWISLETFIGDAASRDTFSYLIVTDRSGVVRGASDNSLVGKMYQPNENDVLISETEDVHTTSTETADGKNIFNIKTPILFQSTEVGQIILGLSQDGLDEVKRITGWLMFILALITTSSVAVVMFIFGGLIARPFKVLNDSLKGFAAGNLDTRISLARNDEFGEAFDSFNNMAAAIQDRYTEVTDELAQTGIDRTGITDNNSKDTDAETEHSDSNSAQKSVSDPGVDLGPDETVISNSQIDLKNKSDQATKKAVTQHPEPSEVSENKAEVESEIDEDADRTIISNSQIGLNTAPNEASKEITENVKKPEMSETSSDVEVNPDQTVISSSQIIINEDSDVSDGKPEDSTSTATQTDIAAPPKSTKETEVQTPAKKPPVKRRTRKKPVKAPVEAEDAIKKDTVADPDESAKS
ncbi:protein kinase [uncultured Paraglaciecola sp.]|uniref:protein kinase domain-containing protein n=1 Tax=uncultured Paraglaciecola sp. TaxID=1765024 RepID=UPI0030D777D9|tara:strand:+ start:464732 stop:467014 length:2283 start_codon:yes stop_codon:yes gene_type:complete